MILKKIAGFTRAIQLTCLAVGILLLGLAAVNAVEIVEDIAEASLGTARQMHDRVLGDKNTRYYVDPNLEDDEEVRIYRVTFVTADKFEAGTDSDPYLIIYGTQGSTSVLDVDAHMDSFSDNLWNRGGTETITIMARDVGAITRITLGVDGHDAWRPATVKIEVDPHDRTDLTYEFKVFENIENGTRDFAPRSGPKVIRRELLSVGWLVAGGLGVALLLGVLGPHLARRLKRRRSRSRRRSR